MILYRIRKMEVRMKLKWKFTVIAVCAAFMFVVFIKAAEPIPKTYVALGDSIAYGFGLYDVSTQAYTNLVAAELDVDLVNYAVNGMTSTGLLGVLENMEEASAAYIRLKNASVITVSIGSNDLLSKLSDVWYVLSGRSDAEAIAAFEAAVTSEEKFAQFDSGLETYRVNLPLIYEKLRAINPTAQIIMTEFYNPYYNIIFGSFDFGALSDEYIRRMNGILYEAQKETGFAIAYVYDAFNAPGRTNVDLSVFNMDPHPNPEGHALLAGAVLSAVNYEILPQNEPDTQTAGSETTGGTSAQDTAAPDEEDTIPETAADDRSYNQKSMTGTVLLAAAAVTAFAVTGLVISKRNKKRQ